MEPATAKRGRGRPRKDGQPVKSSSKPKNPDCEPASKAFVKCIARKMHSHTHEQSVDGSLLLLTTIGLWVIFLVDSYSHTTDTQFLSEQAGLVVFGMTIVCSVLMIELYIIGTRRTTIPKEDSSYLDKYIPPEEIKRICDVFDEPKKECEE